MQTLYPPLNKDGERLNESDEKEFLNRFVTFVKKKNIAQRITQPENQAIFKTVPDNSTYAEFGTYYLDLNKYTIEELFSNIHAKHRNVIRNAEKKDVIIKYGKEVLSDFYELYRETMERSNMYCQSFSYFTNLYDSLPDNIICGVAYFNNVPQGGLFIPFTEFAAFYLFGASAAKVNVNGAINYLHWNTIKLLKEKNVKRYDFVGARLSDVSGTKLEGIQLFKQRFGAELDKGYLWKENINKFDCLVFDVFVYSKHKINKLIPPKDIIDEEIEKHNRVLESIYVESFSDKVKRKISYFLKRNGKLLRNFKKTIQQQELVEDLALAGIGPGDTLLVHSSLSKIGNLAEGGKTVIDALIKSVGKEGNIAMPAYSYVESMEKTFKMPDYIFDPEKSPSVVGKITEIFRKMPGVKRSHHPTHSICAIGPQADLILSGHKEAATNFGKNTPFHKIRELKGKIVGLGINLGPVTIYHTIEDFYPELFKGVYLPEPANLKMMLDSKTVEKKIFIHNPDYHKDRIDKNPLIEKWLHEHLSKKGILHESNFGKGTIWWMDIQTLFDELILLRKNKISIYKVPNN
ncbi:MAG: peptidoglycan bridge formation glycyltransferase FemA/FemB family protein [Bacteroidia bacterium]